MPADIAEAGRTEDRIGRGMTHDVGVRMAKRAAIGSDRDAADYQRAAVDQAVQIVPDACASGADRAGTEPRSRQILFRGDFHVSRISIDHMNLVSSALSQCGF